MSTDGRSSESTMDAERWRRTEELFHAAMERPADCRAAFLHDACGVDDALRGEVESLIASHEAARGFIESPASDDALRVLAAHPVSAAGTTRLGPYRVIREIGHGGMGAVYLGERDDHQYWKQVAIKIIRPGFMDADVLRRFHTERQILASLDHPNIARLLDGGTTEDGLPYIVMEYVEGTPIDQYCDRARLSIADRLKLFRDICSAVHYAHRHLIVHRDIKHSNILVTPEGVPKLLDFGIAKLIDTRADLPGASPDLTVTGQRALTLEYASPEQIRGERITTATDVYSLGVLLYRLLTGHHPYLVAGRPPHEIMKTICDEEPLKPSTAVLRVEEVTDAVTGERRVLKPETKSDTRGGPPERLRRQLRGDIDTIVLMAIRKEPERRYESVERFSEDIHRYLSGLTVIARKPTLAYRSGKFAGRHKVGVLAGALALMMLIGGVVTISWQARIAAIERDRARVEVLKAEQINAFLQDMLRSASPELMGREVTVAQIVHEAARRAEYELRNQPEVEAAVHTTLGKTYMGLGDFDAAEHQLRAALELVRQLFGRESPEAAAGMSSLGVALKEKGDVESAEPLFHDAMDTIRRTTGPNDVRRSRIMNDFAEFLQMKGDLDGAESMHRNALALRRAASGFDDPEVAESLNDLAVVLGTRGRYAEAEKLHREALQIVGRTKGRETPQAASILSNIAWLKESQKDYGGAEPLFREALAMRRKILGNDHPDVAWTLYNLAYLMYEKADYPDAVTSSREVLEMRGRVLADSHPMVAGALHVLGRSLQATGSLADAEQALRESLDLRRKTLPPTHWLIANSESTLGECLAREGKLPDAERLLLRSYEGLKSTFGASHEKTREALERIIVLYEAWKRPADAERYRDLRRESSH